METKKEVTELTWPTAAKWIGLNAPQREQLIFVSQN